VAVRNGIEDGFGQQCAEELYLLLVTGRAKPAAFAGKGQKYVATYKSATSLRCSSFSAALI
jgi:hypothetical protein